MKGAKRGRLGMQKNLTWKALSLSREGNGFLGGEAIPSPRSQFKEPTTGRLR